MTVYELNRDQLTELKQNYYTQLLDERGESPSQYELANIDDYVSDETIYKYYEDTYFSADDFFSSADEEMLSLEIGECSGTRTEIANMLHGIADRINDGSCGGIEYTTTWGLDVIG